LSSRFLFVILDIIAPLVAGYFLNRRQLMNDRVNTFLIKTNIIVILTLMSISCFWILPLSAELLWLPIYGILFTLLPGGLAMAAFARRFRNYLDRGAYVVSAMMSNIGTIGGVCAYILYGELGFAYVNLMATPQNILLVVLCFPLARYYYDKHQAAEARVKFRFNLREMFLTWNQLPFVGMLVGMALKHYGVERPQAVADAFQVLVHAGAWVSLLPVGYLLNFSRASSYFGQVWTQLPLRYLLVPCLMFALAKLLFTDQIILACMLLVALTPSAINAVLTARLYQLNVDITTAAFLLTTPIFLVVIFPMLYFYLAWGGIL